ncbi:MAG: L-seryl-tRNA(Sec) selenium transferase [Bryobacteraceae bacterium]
MSETHRLRELPSVDEVLGSVPDLLQKYPRELVVSEIRRVIDGVRKNLRAGREEEPARIETRVRQALSGLTRPSLRRVINATGVVLHTNLGRAPLAKFVPIEGYSNLEYDLDTGGRGKRDVHVSALIERLFGQPGIAVNNNAAAVFLALHELAASGEVIVSRGELIEIGDGFRIPDIMVSAGAVLREVGTTNRTRIEDYRNAISDHTRLILRVHPSNFEIRGFTGKPELQELAALGKEHGIPVYEDLGSGCAADLRAFGIDEPLVTDSFRQGVDLVSFSGDKLLGGPQAGILAGRAPLVSRIRRNPMFRALRLDKLIYQALESTLRDLLLGRIEEIPALRMIAEPPDSIRARAEALLATLGGAPASVIHGESVIGGGSTPGQPIPTWLIALTAGNVVELERKLRLSDPPVIARIENNQLLLDLRTVLPGEEAELAAALRNALL